jgi:hypothetical protein
MSDELYPLTEATDPPGKHRGDHALVEATMYSGDIVLLCDAYQLYWLTGLRDDGTARLISNRAVLQAAQARYGGEGMPARWQPDGLCRDCLLIYSASALNNGKCAGCRGDSLQGRMFSVGHQRNRRKRAA